MQHHRFGSTSELVSFAVYNDAQHKLYLTFRSGKSTIAYQNIRPELWDELIRSAYPDVCIRFKIQAKHAFQRIEPAFEDIQYSFVK